MSQCNFAIGHYYICMILSSSSRWVWGYTRNSMQPGHIHSTPLLLITSMPSNVIPLLYSAQHIQERWREGDRKGDTKTERKDRKSKIKLNKYIIPPMCPLQFEYTAQYHSIRGKWTITVTKQEKYYTRVFFCFCFCLWLIGLLLFCCCCLGFFNCFSLFNQFPKVVKAHFSQEMNINWLLSVMGFFFIQLWAQFII